VNLQRLQSLPLCGVSYDVETHRIQSGLLAPPLVCGAIALYQEADDWGRDIEPQVTSDLATLPSHGEVKAPIRTQILDKRAAIEVFLEILRNPAAVMTGANIPFDLLVLAVECRKIGIDVMPLIFRALHEHRIFDVQTCEQLNAVADGFLGRDPRTGGPLLSPETGRRAGYSLSVCVDLNCGRVDAKVNDEWREKYDQLENVPLAEWPPTAVAYPQDDVFNNHDVTLRQTGHLPKVSPSHQWGPPVNGKVACRDCGVGLSLYAPPCLVRRPHRNLHDLSNQVWTAFSMHLGASYGFRVNQDSVNTIANEALRGRDEDARPFVAAGILSRNPDGTYSQSLGATKRRIALAYGCDVSKPCATCSGTGKVLSPKAKPSRCRVCRGKASIVAQCAECRGAGKCVYAGSSNAPLIQCKTCAATGLDLSVAPNLPLTPKDGVAYGRDVLNESADEQLISLADFQEDAKVLNVYVPYLMRGRACENCGQHGTDDFPHRDDCYLGPRGSVAPRYRSIPLTLWPNVLLETGRTSYRGVIQLFPRKGGYWVEYEDNGEKIKRYIPSLRECIEARPGHVLASVDYEAGELVTHSQSCIWITGHSELARALLNGVKPHNALAATMIGLSYEEFQRRVKEKVCKDARQAAKPPNFGYPGGMGPAKLVLQQRKQGPDTPHPSGPTLVKDEATGNLVRGYRGLRFCILMDNAPACGVQKETKWRGRPIPPTCRACIECAVRLKGIWSRQWPENEPYFKFVNECVQDGMPIDETAILRWPHLAEVFRPGSRLAPGEIMQHVSGRIRQVATSNTESPFCSAANGFFQGLLADLAKAALRRISWECYDPTYRVPHQLYSNSITSRYAGGQSPLYGDRVIVFQHDEILPELREDSAHDAARRVSEIMVDEMRHYCPDLAGAAAAPPALMRKWWKSAEPRYQRGGDKPADGDDKLIPWEPKKT
jgi:hypothetical protein